MQSIAEFLESSPKNYLNQIHKRVNSGNGLLSNAKIIEGVKDWATNSERIETTLQQLTDDQQKILLYIYASGSKGMEFNKLQNSFKKFSKNEISDILDILIWHLLIVKRKGTQPVFFGFSDIYKECITATQHSQFSFKTPEIKHWCDYSFFLPYHYVSTLAYVSQQSVKITNTGDIHKKYINHLTSRFTYSMPLSETATTDELDLILNFAYSARHIMQCDLTLYTTPQLTQFLKLKPEQQFYAFLNWWEELRFKKNLVTFRALIESLPESPESILTLCELWWVYDLNRKKNYSEEEQGVLWEDLPKIIRELWVLGIVELSVEHNVILAIKRSALGNCWIKNDAVGIVALLSQSQPFCTQDFEILFPVQSFGQVQYILEHIGIPLNDDRLVKYSLTKARTLEGMSSALTLDDISLFKSSLTLPQIVVNNFTEWVSESTNSEICEAYLLKVHTPSKFEELKSFPEFLAHTLETIPGYGFILKHENEEAVRELLSHFGLTPPTNKIQPKLFLKEIKENAISPTWKMADSIYYDLDYTITEPKVKEKESLKNSVYTAPPKNMDFGQILKNIKYAVLMEEQVEVIWHEVEESRAILNNKRKRSDETRRHTIVAPVSLNQNKDPITLHSIDVSSNKDIYINVNEIEFIKILEN